jgi:aspartyl protease family protein
MKLPPLLALALSLACGATHALDINVIGLFPGKAVLVIDGGSPKTYAVGATIAEGVKLIATDGASATIEAGGKRETIPLGQHTNRVAPAAGASVTLQAGGNGHFIAETQINGAPMRMLVDTGASLIALPARDAARLGINYRKGKLGYSNTANGVVPIYLVTLDSVRIGDIELNQVEAMVHENGLSFGLLGMSFLNRTEMRREGQQMTLIKRY